MKQGMNIAFFGSSLVSAYWNGAATYYRGMIRALHERGHRVTFYEPDAFERQQHRDIPDPPWARVVVYPATEAQALRAVEQARGADLVVKASGVGVFDALLERAVLELQSPDCLVAFWDVDAPATLDRMHGDRDDPLRALVPRYDLVLTYGGGDPVRDAYLALGAQDCVPVYNALDPATHHRCQRSRASNAISRSSATGCPTGRRGSRSSSCGPPRCCPASGCCWAAAAGATSPCPRASNTWAMSTPPTTTPSTARPGRC
jgi:spore maturation protein CgeB